MERLMRRRHLIELHELSWCPRVIRQGLTDFLEVAIEQSGVYKPIRPVLFDAIKESRVDTVVDICSGAGGPWLSWCRRGLLEFDVTLTDKFPNPSAASHVTENRSGRLQYCPRPVDATQFPPDLRGSRTIFTSFHHFTRNAGEGIIRDAIFSWQPIGIFEFTSRQPRALLLMMLLPIAVWVMTPRIRPIKRSRLFFTYVLPLIPLVVLIDGAISCWRTYTVDELDAMTGGGDYEWRRGTMKGPRWPLPVT
jgi:hypothetical protein